MSVTSRTLVTTDVVPARLLRDHYSIADICEFTAVWKKSCAKRRYSIGPNKSYDDGVIYIPIRHAVVRDGH